MFLLQYSVTASNILKIIESNFPNVNIQSNFLAEIELSMIHSKFDNVNYPNQKL